MEVARAFHKAGLSIVLIDRDVTEYPQRSDYDLVAMDNFHAGCLLGLHLAERGSKRIAFVAKPEYPATTDHRLVGVLEGVGRSGGAAVDFHVGNPEEISFVEKVLRKSPPYDAVICSNDLTAAQWLQSATQKGWRVPADFKLAGFDDVRYAALLSVPLTTVRQPCRSIGIASVDAMQSRLERPLLPARNITLRGELVLRASTENAAGQITRSH